MAWNTTYIGEIMNLSEVTTEQLAAEFQQRLFSQQGINTVNGEVLANIINAAEAEIICRMAPIEDY